eukprot:3904669-Amphidinium_carterae.1
MRRNRLKSVKGCSLGLHAATYPLPDGRRSEVLVNLVVVCCGCSSHKRKQARNHLEWIVALLLPNVIGCKGTFDLELGAAATTAAQSQCRVVIPLASMLEQ